MIKILLVYEDYNQLVSVETSFKKIGFDVLGITNEYSLSDKMLSFNPELVIVSGEAAGKVKTQSIGEKLREMSRWPGKVILIFSKNQNPLPEDLMKVRVDQVLVQPVEISTLLTTIAMLTNQDANLLLERLAKYSSPGAEGDIPQGYSVGARHPSSQRSEDSQFIQGSKGFTNDDAGNVSVFSEVNFNELVKELQIGGHSSSGVDVEQPPPVQEFLEVDPIQEINTDKLISELHDSEEAIEQRMEGYKKYISKKIFEGTPSALTRVALFAAHKNMSKNWDRGLISRIDTERRRFTNFLFQKIKK